MTHRFEIAGQARFLTFSCNHRLPLFSNDRIKDLFVDHLVRVKSETHFRLFAWVLMPEHAHLLVLPRLPEFPIKIVLINLKKPFAKEVLRRWRDLDAPILERLSDANGCTRFWLKGGGYDRNVRSMEEYHEKIRYIEENPVRRGLVNNMDEWKWSSCWWRKQEGYDGVLVDSAFG
jgi:putative transposase